MLRNRPAGPAGEALRVSAVGKHMQNDDAHQCLILGSPWRLASYCAPARSTPMLQVALSDSERYRRAPRPHSVHGTERRDFRAAPPDDPTTAHLGCGQVRSGRCQHAVTSQPPGDAPARRPGASGSFLASTVPFGLKAHPRPVLPRYGDAPEDRGRPAPGMAAKAGRVSWRSRLLSGSLMGRAAVQRRKPRAPSVPGASLSHSEQRRVARRSAGCRKASAEPFLLLNRRIQRTPATAARRNLAEARRGGSSLRRMRRLARARFVRVGSVAGVRKGYCGQS